MAQEHPELIDLRAELERLRARVRELEDAENRFRILADTAPVMIWMAGTDTLCDFFNKPWLEFTGRTMAQEMGNGWAEGVHPDDLQRCLEIYLSSFHARRPFRMEYRLRRHDGEPRWLLDSGTPRYGPDGTFTGYIGSCIDITEQRELAARALHAQKLEAVGRLAGGVAHDFNNILTGIDGFVELAMRSVAVTAPAYRDLLQVRRATKRGTDVTSQLLAFSRMQVMHNKVVDLVIVLDHMRAMLETLLGERVQLELDGEAETAYASVDQSQLEQVIVNLAINARDAIAGDGRITIRVAPVELADGFVPDHLEARPGPYVLLELRDTGSGMDEATRARIFEPFFTTKAIGEGTGLGLAMVYGVIERSGGCIELETELGNGTAFRVYLPAATPDPTLPVAAVRPEPIGRESVLLVEDDEVVRAFVTRVLQTAGYTVLAAKSGSEALTLPDLAHASLLLTDVVMPGMGGRELAERLVQQHPDIRIVYISGYTEDALLKHALPGRKLEFIQKPFTSQALLERVRAVLDATALPPAG